MIRNLILATCLLFLPWSVASAGPAASGPTSSETYTWFDGDRERTFLLSGDRVAVFANGTKADKTAGNAATGLTRAMTESVVERFEGRIGILRSTVTRSTAEHASLLGARPGDANIDWVDAVFTPTTGKKDSPFLLTGEMIVHFSSETSDVEAVAWANRHDISAIRSLKLDNAWLFTCPAGPACLETANNARQDAGVRYAYPNWVRPKEKRNDPLLPDQWHLVNTGQGGGTAGEDANIQPAWNSGFTGNGIDIVVIDDGVDIAHPDLSGNVVSGSYDYVDSDTNPSGSSLDPINGAHGTSCAGVAAGVGLNSTGVRGAGYNSGLVGYRLLGADTDANSADALTRNYGTIEIFSNSWGPADTGQDLAGGGPLAMAALADGIANGRGGLGTLYVWAGGNGNGSGDNSNYDSYANSRYSIAVAASTNLGTHSSYSEPGANILINAPSNGGTLGITTTDRTGSNGYDPTAYTDSFGGTSSSTPLVAGALAVILEANPNLTWRDMKLLLAETAEKNDPGDADWTNNGAGMPVNHKYGFGRIDTNAAVQAAGGWTAVGAEITSMKSRSPNLAIADGTGAGSCGAPTTDTLTINDNVSIEFVEVEFESDHTFWGDLEIKLISPAGTTSVLAEQHGSGSGSDLANGWTFGVERLIGEDAFGTWTIEVRDCYNADTGSLLSWSVKAFGTTPATAALDLQIAAASISESAGIAATTATVTRNSGTSGALTVNLSSDDTSEATVPATVTIPAGQASATFDMDAIDDAILDGTRTVTITATAAGHDSDTDTVDVTDNETTAVSLSIAKNSMSENGGTSSVTVSRSSGTAGSLTVNLSSNDTSEATVPASVVIPNGQVSTNVTVTAVDDAIADGTQTVTLTASAAGHAGGTDTIAILDDEIASVIITLADLVVSEGDGAAATTATLTRNSSIASSLTVNLSSSDTSEATVPATVQIPAGQSSTTFDIDAVDDAIVDGPQWVAIMPSAPGHGSNAETLKVEDDDGPLLTLTLSADIVYENAGAGSVTVTVTRNNTDTSSPLTFSLTSSDTTEVSTAPGNFVIPAGQSSTSFAIDIIDDIDIDGDQTVILSVSKLNFLGDSKTLLVRDNDKTNAGDRLRFILLQLVD